MRAAPWLRESLSTPGTSFAELMGGTHPLLILRPLGMPAESVAREVQSRMNAAFKPADCRLLTDLEDFDEKIQQHTQSSRSMTVIFLEHLELLRAELQAPLLDLVRPKPWGEADSRSSHRIIAAASLRIRSLAHEGGFCPELFYCLWKDRILIPSLRELRARFSEIVESILIELNAPACSYRQAFDQEARRLLEDHSWTGNVLQLRGAVSVAIRRSKGAQVQARHLDLDEAGPAAKAGFQTVGRPPSKPRIPVTELRDRKANGESVAKLADEAGVSRSTLYSMLKRLP